MEKEKIKATKNFTKLTQSGISLIVLIVTIIVVIILAAVVILTISKNNPIESAKEATFKEDVRDFQDDLTLTISKEYTSKQGQRDEKINAEGYDNIVKYIPSFSRKYDGKFKIVNDELVYIEEDETEIKWCEDLNITVEYTFNAEKWDKTSTDEDCFYWDGTTITGFIPEKLSGVTKVRIPSKCTAIRSDYAWLGTEDYRNFIAGITVVELPDTVTEIGDYAFHNFRELTEIKMSSNVTSIGNSAFFLCYKLADITIPKSVTRIGSFAFEECVSLTNITIPEGVTNIGTGAFYACRNLTNIVIPEGVTSIGGFGRCAKLTNLIIPSSVTSIEDMAFAYSPNLTNINFQGTISEWNNISKSNDWNLWSSITTITCTDGTITL